MANALKHKTQSPALIGQTAWQEEHLFAGGAMGSVLTWDATASDKVTWKQALGLNEATPGTGGTIAATMSLNGATSIRLKRFTDTGPSGNFVDFQAAGGASLFSIGAAYGEAVGFKDRGGQVFNIRAYGATGGANDAQAIADAYAAAVAAGGGIVFFPPGIWNSTVQLNFDGASNITLQGAGPWAYGPGASRLRYTGGAVASFISARKSKGFTIAGMTVESLTANPAILVDLRGTDLANIATCATLRDSVIHTAGSVAIAVRLVVVATIENCNIKAATTGIGIRGIESAGDEGATNAINVLHSHFYLATGTHVQGAGQGWVIQGNTFEAPTTNSFKQGAVARALDLVYVGNWHGDAGAAVITWVDFDGQLLIAHGNTFGDAGTTAYNLTGPGTAMIGDNFQNIPSAQRIVATSNMVVNTISSFPNTNTGFGIAVPRGYVHAYGGGYAYVQGSSGAGGTAFTSSDTIPIFSGQGFSGYDGLALLPKSWGNATTIDQHRAIYIGGAQRNAGGAVATLAFANWGYFTGPSAGAGGLGNATAQGDAVKFRVEHSDQGGEFAQRIDLITRSATGTNVTALSIVSAGGVTHGVSTTTPVVYGGTAAGSTLTLAGTSGGAPSNAYVIINPTAQGAVGIATAAPTGRLTTVTTDDTTPTTVSAFDARHSLIGATNEGCAISYSATNGRAYLTALKPGVAWKELRIQSAKLEVYDSTTNAVTVTMTDSIKIGGTAARATTAGTNRLDIFDGIAPVGTLANGVSLYSTAGELRVMDAAGNATLLSPHDTEGYWIFDSGSARRQLHLRIDVERLLRALNERFGYDFVHEFAVKGA